MNSILDYYYKKSIPFRYEGESLVFKVSQELFSSHVIDYGTQRLLRTLSTERINKFGKVLDLGCGYGPIGISLKKLNPRSEMHMTDTDALALEYSRLNATLNKADEIKIYGSLGYDNIVDTDFDLIVSNIPAKVGEKALSHMLLGAQYYLRPGGKVAIVVIDAITKYINESLRANQKVRVIFQKSWPGHTIFHYIFEPGNKPMKPVGSSLLRGVYDRTESKFSFNNNVLSLKTVYNLPEFDTISYDTELLLESLSSIKKGKDHSIMVFNPGQGHVPLALSGLADVKKIILVDRDLLALEASKRNLQRNHFPDEKIFTSHQIGLLLKDKQRISNIVGVIPEKQNPEVYKKLIEQSAIQLEPEDLIIFSSSSNVAFKMERLIQSTKSFKILESTRSRGKRVIIANKMYE